ncbi:MAG: preprotein translocase subunit SecG [Myxococcales bacterium]|nr:preprotein translocase subunit SecG [Myxococcales bacterium]
MTLFIEIVYVFITTVLILVVLLQAGRGGGLGTALGGGASQGVFGGGGGADFLAKLTQGLAAGFMICAVYLAYASSHAGSSRLAESGEEEQALVDEDEEVDYEAIGEGTPLKLPEADEATVAQPEAAAEPTPTPTSAEPTEPTEPTELVDGFGEDAEHAVPEGGQDAEGTEPSGDAPKAPATPEGDAPTEPAPTPAPKREATDAEAPTVDEPTPSDGA